MLSEHFELQLMKIGRIELELFKFYKWTHKRTPCIIVQQKIISFTSYTYYTGLYPLHQELDASDLISIVHCRRNCFVIHPLGQRNEATHSGNISIHSCKYMMTIIMGTFVFIR